MMHKVKVHCIDATSVIENTYSIHGVEICASPLGLGIYL